MTGPCIVTVCIHEVCSADSIPSWKRMLKSRDLSTRWSSASSGLRIQHVSLFPCGSELSLYTSSPGQRTGKKRTQPEATSCLWLCSGWKYNMLIDFLPVHFVIFLVQLFLIYKQTFSPPSLNDWLKSHPWCLRKFWHFIFFFFVLQKLHCNYATCIMLTLSFSIPFILTGWHVYCLWPALCNYLKSLL